MNQVENRFNQYIENNPKQSLQLLLIGLCSIWMSSVAALGFILYLILSRVIKAPWWLILTIELIFVLEVIFLNTGDGIAIKSYLLSGFKINLGFWKLLFNKADFSPVIYLYHQAGSYLFGFPVLFAGMLSVVDLIKESPHKPVIDAIQKGEHYQEKK